MRVADIPFNEELRLKDLWAHNILDTINEQSFDELAELAAFTCDCPIALISLLDKDRQWFKAKKGIDVCETSRDISFCAHAILEEDVFVIENALEDERFFDNPAVTDGIKLRFYAGAPIYSTNGFKLGTICVVDDKPKTLSAGQIKALKMLANQVTQLLELNLKNNIIKDQAKRLVLKEKQIAQQTIWAQEKERALIGRELHENFAQTLTAMKLYLDVAEGSEEKRLAYIDKSKQCLVTVLDEVKVLSKSIVPTTLKNDSIKDIINHLITQYKSRTGKKVYFECSNDINKVEDDKALTLFRIIEEQLKNIEQHAEAQTVFITISVEDKIQLLIKDDGKGFDSSTFKRGNGLNNIKTRLEYFGGRVTITSIINEGCNLEAIIP